MFDSFDFVIDIVLSMRWNDLLDILIVSALIYYLLKFLLGTKGWQILIGIMVILSIWFTAKLLDLNTIVWIFNNLWTVGIFLIIVLFQPEIRKALAKLGERGLLGDRAGFYITSFNINKRTVDEVIRASTFLAEHKIGALIVFERNTNLLNYAEGCTKLDATVSLELLISIFEPKTPLHDGAVVIKDNRISFVKCVLPLTINPDIPSELGTRHRAGLGITEETDAVAVIVSEERGTISIAVNGKLYKDVDPLTLKKLLFDLLGIEKSKDRKPLTKRIISTTSKVNRWKSSENI